MNCIACNSPHTRVNNSRKSVAKRSVWRRRTCQDCKTIFTTVERIDLSQLKVHKNSGRLQPFSLFKLQLSIWKALAGPDSAVEAEELALTAYTQLIRADSALTTQEVRTITHSVLANYDAKAALRYNSF